MSKDLLTSTLRRLRRLSGASFAGSLTDAELVARLAANHDEAAFEVLVWRHGPMVLNACHRILHHAQDAEDAFQATFLVLFRKVHTLGKHESVGAWLHRVAFRVALRARKSALKRMASAGDLGFIADRHDGSSEVPDELQALVDKEINRLPERLRRVAVLCLLQGQSYADAAAEIGCPLGTVQSRLARARQRLQARLTAQGVTASAAIVLIASAPASAAAMTPALVHTALTCPRGAVSAAVAALTHQTLRSLGLARLASGFAKGVLAAALFGVAGWLGASMLENPLEPKLPRDVGPLLSRQQDIAAARQLELQKDLGRIEGEWQLVAGIVDGAPMPADEIKATVLTFLPGNRVSLGCRRPDDRFAIVPHGQPPRIELAVTQADGETLTRRGVYEFTDDSLRICLGSEDRPARDFSSSTGSGRRLWIFRRPGAQ